MRPFAIRPRIGRVSCGGWFKTSTFWTLSRNLLTPLTVRSQNLVHLWGLRANRMAPKNSTRRDDCHAATDCSRISEESGPGVAPPCPLIAQTIIPSGENDHAGFHYHRRSVRIGGQGQNYV